MITPLVAEMVTDLVVVTVRVVTVNVVVVVPATSVTLAGTVATEVKLLERVITAPPVGAGPFKVTVPVEGVPPLTLLGFRARALSTGAVTVKAVVRVAP